MSYIYTIKHILGAIEAIVCTGRSACTEEGLVYQKWMQIFAWTPPGPLLCASL